MCNRYVSQREEFFLAQLLVNRVQEKASGRSDRECLHNKPRDVYFIGNLRPSIDEVSEQTGRFGYSRESLNKLSPIAFGAEFLLEVGNEPIKVGITINWACYYRIFPTFLQQSGHQRQYVEAPNFIFAQSNSEVGYNRISDQSDDKGRNDKPIVINSSEVFDSPIYRRRIQGPQDSLFIRFRKINCQATGDILLQFNHQTSRWVAEDTKLKTALTKEVVRAKQIALSDIECVRTDNNPDSKIRVPDTVLASETAYISFLETLHTTVVPEWLWDVRCNMRALGNTEHILEVEFINTSPSPINSPNVEPYLFDTKAHISIPSNTVKPFEIELAPRDFRYNRYMWGRGINCAIEPQSREENNVSTFLTTHMPMYSQLRYSTELPPAKAGGLQNKFCASKLAAWAERPL